MIDKEAIHESYGTALINRGLVEAEYPDEMVSARSSGDSHPIGFKVTDLGNLLLRSIAEMLADSNAVKRG